MISGELEGLEHSDGKRFKSSLFSELDDAPLGVGVLIFPSSDVGDPVSVPVSRRSYGDGVHFLGHQ